MEAISHKIINWYQLNKRDLPWRKTKNPYLIWISEIILQQTRVDQGMGYYLRFVKEFPTVIKLAKANEEKILKLWQGLGYYSRARNLHATAQFIAQNFKGKFPSDYNELLKLKGVGEYTAAAIASFAFNHCYPVVDGNVFRVLSRIFGIETPIDTTKGKQEFYNIAKALIDKSNPSLFNQAIMEFGAMQCKPKNPDCLNCPLCNVCVAFSKKLADKLPLKSKKIKQSNRFFNYLVFRHADTLIINKRNQDDIWKNLYDFPLIETKELIAEQEFLLSKELKKILGTNKYTISSISKTLKHILSHQRIYARFWEISLTKSVQLTSLKLESPIIIKQSKLHNYAVPRLVEAYLQSNNLL